MQNSVVIAGNNEGGKFALWAYVFSHFVLSVVIAMSGTTRVGRKK